MWSKVKIQHQKEYFAEQRKNPTGKFTEFVVRTYYCIYKCCSVYKSIYCPANDVSNSKIKNIIYENFYNNQPDHDYVNVINDCKKHLTEMGYIHLEYMNGREIIFLDKTLDFLVPGEHEYYLQKYHIPKDIESQSQFNIDIHPIQNEDELTALLNHMVNPEQYKDPYEKEMPKMPFKKAPANIPCEICDGYYIFRKGRFGNFFGCSNYPKCKSTKSIADVSYSFLTKHGINIYETETPCWKCGKSIKIRSYFPQIDLLISQPELASTIDLYVIRLSVVDTFDQFLSKQYKEIYMKASKKAGFEYMANNCPYCGSLQGSQLTLEKMYNFLLDALKGHTVSNYIVGTISVNEATLPKSEWKEVIDEVMKVSE
jgi:ssDNA-binding Zn-finger/Zn-ribbon topoisomerase 1